MSLCLCCSPGLQLPGRGWWGGRIPGRGLGRPASPSAHGGNEATLQCGEWRGDLGGSHSGGRVPPTRVVRVPQSAVPLLDPQLHPHHQERVGLQLSSLGTGRLGLSCLQPPQAWVTGDPPTPHAAATVGAGLRVSLEKEMATHSSVLAWRIPGTGEPGGLLSMGSHRVGHD